MNTLKAITTTIALLIGVASGYAQSGMMKDPVSFKLKNGVTVIVAENQTISKVFANLSFEASDHYTPEKASVQELLNTLLNQQLTALNIGLSYSSKGVNLTTLSADFKTGLQTLYTCISAPDFTQSALDKAKADVLAHLTAQDKYLSADINKASLTKITLDDLKAYYREINDPTRTYLTIAGNITPSTAKSFTRRATDQPKQKHLLNNDKTYLASKQ